MPTWIYFAKMTDSEGRALIKIGHSRNVSLRRKILQTGAPARLEMLGVIKGGEAVERRLHQRFHASHVHGEWYRADKPLLDYVRRYVKPVPEPVERISVPKVPAEVHFRVSLRIRGKAARPRVRAYEEHKNTPHLSREMTKALRAAPDRASVLITICKLDQECPAYHDKVAIESGFYEQIKEG